MGFGGDPWHQWGSTQNVEMIGAGGVSAPAPVRAQQLVRVEYHYPITWAFFLSAHITHSNMAVPLINAVIVDFDVNIGVGRSNVHLDPFARAQFSGVQVQQAGLAFRFSDSVQAEPLDPFTGFDPASLQPAPNVVRQLTAQSIQIGATLRSTGAQTNGDQIMAAITAYVAPITHVRPEWFIGKFGNELGGK